MKIDQSVVCNECGHIDKKVEVVCDICKQSTSKGLNCEFATLSATWGYYSKKDTEMHTVHLCEICYDKVIEFIKSLGGTVQVMDYTVTDF